MKAENENQKRASITYSCYYKQSREGEQFVADHVLNYQITGTSLLSDGNSQYESREGTFRFIRRNQLLKFSKHPPANGEYQSLSILFIQETLKSFSLAYEVLSEQKPHEQFIFTLQTNSLLESYANSLLTYRQSTILENAQMVDIKLNEGILLLLQTNPALKDILFDFNDPHKIDLESFMNKNYHFNVHLERFAYLTGRSLATFKRDFEKIFGVSPRHWLQQKRLKEAYYLIHEKGKIASDIYLDLGFEDLSHFSFAFKKAYGVAPTKIISIQDNSLHSTN